jgi:uncharacterized protein YndB with AHSA1/START domain
MFKWLFGGREPRSEAGGNAELIVVGRTVDAPPERAFEVFVDRFGSWWPRERTWAGGELADTIVTAATNGRCFERRNDGTEAVWGTVLTVSRPDHIVIAWQIGPDRTPEASEATASRLDVRFVAGDGGGTDVVVVHRDFPRHGDGWRKYRAEMAGKQGWPMLIEAYARAVASA